MTTDDVFGACPTGPAAGARRVVLAQTGGLAVGPAAATDEASPGRALRVWLADLLLGQVEAEDGVWAWLAAAGEDDYWEGLAGDCATDAKAAPVCALTAGRYLALSRRPGVFDVATGRPVPADELAGLVAASFETRIFNLRQLFRHCLGKTRPGGPSPGTGTTHRVPDS